MSINDITFKTIGSIFKVYNELGPGLLESVYEQALCYQLAKDGLWVQHQVELPITYDGIQLDAKLRIDVLVEDAVVVELKSVAELAPVHFMQIDTYLKLSEKKAGLLVNFNTDDIRNSIHRRINVSDTEELYQPTDK